MKIVIYPYLSRESSEYDEIWYADENFDPINGNEKNSEIPKFKMADGRHIRYGSPCNIHNTVDHVLPHESHTDNQAWLSSFYAAIY